MSISAEQKAKTFVCDAVSDKTVSRLEIYCDLLEKWNRSINLVSRETIGNVWQRHILDSYQVARLTQSFSSIVDLGSGGGLPGAVIGILNSSSTHGPTVKLIESDQRKCAFLRTVARETSTRLIIENKRIEKAIPAKASIVTARALAPLIDLLPMARRHMNRDGRTFFLKGKNHISEITEAKEKYQFNLEIHRSISQAESAILEISDIQHAAPQ